VNLVLASTNLGKIVEMKRLLGGGGVRVCSMAEEGVAPDVDLPEDGDSFEHNALSKTRALFELLGADRLCLGDDSGLQVDALGGAPGVHSARYSGLASGDPGRDLANNAKLLSELSGVSGPERTARFACCIALLGPGEKLLTARGTCEGHILTEAHGGGGFGYDPLFRPIGFSQTMAQLSLDEKNAISHRGQALKDLVRVMGEAGLLD
jgi:XTP/dITP diphosphohydrolase